MQERSAFCLLSALAGDLAALARSGLAALGCCYASSCSSSRFFKGIPSLLNQPEQEDQGGHIFGPPPVEESIEAYSKQDRGSHIATGKGASPIAAQGSALKAGGQTPFRHPEQRHHHDCRRRDDKSDQGAFWMSTGEQSVDGCDQHIETKQRQGKSHNPGCTVLGLLYLFSLLSPHLHSESPQQNGEASELDDAINAKSSQQGA